MNPSKAREYFSAYAEGSLEPGLRSAFERELGNDAQLQAEYKAFEKTVQALEGLQTNAIEVPSDLHERISARLDKHIWDQKQVSKPTLLTWWKAVALGGAATLAIIGVMASISSRSAGSAAGFGPAVQLNVKPSLIMDNGELILRIPAGSRGIEIRDELTGTLIQSLNPANDRETRSPLRNRSNAARLLTIEFGDGTKKLLVAVPGKVRTKASEDNGTSVELALAAANYYQVAIELTNAGDQKWSWNLTGTQPSDAKITGADGAATTIELGRNGLFFVKD